MPVIRLNTAAAVHRVLNAINQAATPAEARDAATWGAAKEAWSRGYIEHHALGTPACTVVLTAAGSEALDQAMSRAA